MEKNIPDTPPLPALALIKTSPLMRVTARLIIAGFIIYIAALAFLPWRQFVSGPGRVIAFNPLDRRVNIEAQVSGRVKSLRIVEGQRVKKADIIAEIQDNDPNLLTNLRAQRSAGESRRDMAKERVETILSQITHQELGKTQAIEAARQRVDAAKIAAETSELQFKRIDALHSKGISSRRDYELALLQKTSNETSLKSAEAGLKGVIASFDGMIASIRAQLASARSDVAGAERDLTAMDIQINQTLRQVIESPRDGVVYKVTVTDGAYLRPGSPVCIIIPDTDSRFVELWLNGDDAPLVKARTVREDGIVVPGSPVRIAFSGWPAVQTFGWPNLAVGTFGGEVVFVDPTDDGRGRFRVVVAESPDHFEDADGKSRQRHWPDRDRYLRQGSRANGWIMLEKVPLWFEVWRNLNGFPPVVPEYPEESKK